MEKDETVDLTRQGTPSVSTTPVPSSGIPVEGREDCARRVGKVLSRCDTTPTYPLFPTLPSRPTSLREG